jgi:DNA-binding XRE family transcriptional regulator
MSSHCQANVKILWYAAIMKVPKLRMQRERKLLTQEDLGKSAGVSRATIISLEAGADARLSTVRKLATALGLDPGELFGDA